MSDFIDLLQKGPEAAKVELQEPDSSLHEDNTHNESSNKKKPGRPRKGAQEKTMTGSADRVCYVTSITKTTIKKIQAAQTLSSGRTLTESEIISAGLDLYIKHNKLKLN